MNPSIKDVLHSILLAINATESLTDDSCLRVRDNLLSALDEFTNMLEATGYDTDKKLSVFDKVFNDAGWDGQGFRIPHKDGTIVYGEIE